MVKIPQQDNITVWIYLLFTPGEAIKSLTLKNILASWQQGKDDFYLFIL